MFKNVFMVVLFALVLSGAGAWGIMHRLHSQRGVSHADVYFCPMHRFYKSNHPGACPICGMTLVKKDLHAAGNAQNDEQTGLYLSEHQQQLIGLRTAVVKKGTLVKTIRAYGYVTHDLELYNAQLAYIEAWRLYYSFLAHRPTTDEFRQSWREYYKNPSGRAQSEEFRKAQQRLINAEYELVHMGITEDQLEQLRAVKFGQPWVQPDLLFFNGSAWVYAKIYEQDIGFLAPGQKATIEVPAYRTFIEGIVRSISDAVDPMTSTVRVRIELPQAPDDLKADMAVNVLIHSELNDGLLIPSQALIDTGLRSVVYVAKGKGAFELRQVHVAEEGQGQYLIKDGLHEGEEVAIDGNFLLDSESRLEEATHD